MTLLDHLLYRQAGVLTRAQALAAGCTDGRIQAHLRAGRWQRVHRRVYCTTTGELNRIQLLWAALLYAGDGAALSHWTAAELHGITDRGDKLIHVTLPFDRRVRKLPGLKFHRSRRLDDSQVHPQQLPRRTRVERTVVDLIDAAPAIDRAFAWMADACQRRLTTSRRLGSALVEAPGTRWRGALLPALDDVTAGSHSLLERHFLRLSRRHGLPAARHQVRLLDGRRTGWLDCDYGDIRVRVELDGRVGHDLQLDRFRDMRRDNSAATVDRLPLRYGWTDVVGGPCQVAGQVAQVLELRGWAGEPKRCGNGCAL